MKNHDVTTVKIAGGDRMSLQIDGLGFWVFGVGPRRMDGDEKESYICADCRFMIECVWVGVWG